MRLGFHVGPFYASTGSRRGGNGCAIFFALLLLGGLVGLAIQYWAVSLSILGGLIVALAAIGRINAMRNRKRNKPFALTEAVVRKGLDDLGLQHSEIDAAVEELHRTGRFEVGDLLITGTGPEYTGRRQVQAE